MLDAAGNAVFDIHEDVTFIVKHISDVNPNKLD